MWSFERVMMKTVETWKIASTIKNDSQNGTHPLNANM